MIVGSIKENTALEKRVSLTPESAKNIIGLGLKVCLEQGYALHLGINDSEYSDIGAEIKVSSKEVLNSSDLITKVNCPPEEEIGIFTPQNLAAQKLLECLLTGRMLKSPQGLFQRSFSEKILTKPLDKRWRATCLINGALQVIYQNHTPTSIIQDILFNFLT